VRAPSITICALLAMLVAFAGCSDNAASGDGSASTTTAQATDAGVTTTTNAAAIVGDPINVYTLVVGDCFNRYETGTEMITTRVPCEAQHKGEVFAALVHPSPFGDPWPGDDALQQYGLRLCYQNFESFAGIIYELSELGIGVLTPPQVNWEDAKARYRGITCFVQRNDSQPLVGSMRGKAL
jgi:hypothetical protein